MTKYEIIEANFELNIRHDIHHSEGDVISGNDLFHIASDVYLRHGMGVGDKIIASFCEFPAADAYMKNECIASTYKIGKCLCGVLYYIEENEYDDDGEFLQGGDIWTIKADGYEF